MKTTHSAMAKTQPLRPSTQQEHAGSNASSLHPPRYGIELVDDGGFAGAVAGAPAIAVQAKADTTELQGSPEVPAHLPGHGGGAKMPAEVRGKMEAAFGVDFSRVRIHEGSHAQAIGALAYTQGTDIHFAPGQYQPHSQRAQQLLGHELTHVVQQSRGRVRTTSQASGRYINDDVQLEREADEMGARAARGEFVASSASGILAPPASGAVQMWPGEIVERIATALGVATVVAVAIYMAVPASVAGVLATGGAVASGIGEYWLGVVNGIIQRYKGSGQDKQPAPSPAPAPAPVSDKPVPSSAPAPASDKPAPTPASAPAPTSDKPATTAATASKPPDKGKSLLEGVPGDCLYTAVNIARGNGGQNEDVFRRIATAWLVHQPANAPIFQFASQHALIQVVSQPQVWAGDAGDLSAVALAHSLGIRLRIVTAANVYVFDGGPQTVTIYYHDNHYTSFAVPGIHQGNPSEIVAAPKKPSSAPTPDASAKPTSAPAPTPAPSSPAPIPAPSSPAPIPAPSSPAPTPPEASASGLLPKYEQELRNLARSLGAQAGRTAEDEAIQAIIRNALATDRISSEDEARIAKYTHVDPRSLHSYAAPPPKPKAPEQPAASAEEENLANGTHIDYAALDRVMQGVEIGTQVAPNVWRAMRQALSDAITLPNKSHPAHGSNFNRNQRPEQQIRDWAAPLAGPLREALVKYFAKYGVDI